jgi:O-Antigen ligase
MSDGVGETGLETSAERTVRHRLVQALSWLARCALGLIAVAGAVAAVRLALGHTTAPMSGLAAAGIGLLAVFFPEAVMLVVVPVAQSGAAWPVVRVAVLAMIAALALATVLVRHRGVVRLRWAHLVIGVLAALLTVSLLYPAVGVGEGARYNLVTFMAGLAVLAISAAIRLSETLLCAVSALAGAIISGYVMFIGEYANGRLVGLSLNPNYLGALLTLPLVAGVGLAVHRRQVWWLLPATACAVALVATGSRGSTVAAACGLAYVFVVGRRWWLQLGCLVAAAALALALCQVLYVRGGDPAPAVAPASTGTVADAGPGAATATADSGQDPLRQPGSLVGRTRTNAELAYNNSVRAGAATLAAQFSVRHPLRGVGYGAFPHLAAGSSFGIYMNTHNDYLRLSAEAGLPALLAFGVLVAMGLRRRGDRGFAVCRALVVTNLVTLLFANTLATLSVSVLFWAALGVLLANPPLRRAQEPRVLENAEYAVAGR